MLNTLQKREIVDMVEQYRTQKALACDETKIQKTVESELDKNIWKLKKSVEGSLSGPLVVLDMNTAEDAVSGDWVVLKDLYEISDLRVVDQKAKENGVDTVIWSDNAKRWQEKKFGVV
jgi:hypothetical protein